MWPLRSHDRSATVSQDSDRLPEMLAIVGSSRDQTTVADLASSNGWGLTMVSTLAQGLSYADSKTVSVIILDRDLTDNEWRSTVRNFAQNQPRPCIILLSSVMDPYLFDEVVKQGGFDVVAKPIQTDEIRRVGRLAVTFWKNRWAGKPSG
jgi:DNA-binding response OmpR family regulator